MSTADTPTNSSNLGRKTRVPKRLTPHTLRIIRLLASGKTKQEVAAEVGTTYQYIYRLMSTQMAKDEFTKISTAVEQATIQRIASTQSGTDSPISTALTAEVDATVLESIQKLRSIMNSTTSSPQAQAFAAKELLDLSQAKKRLALLDKGLEDGIEVSPDDIRLLASTVRDLRILHLKDVRTASDLDTVLRRFSSTEAEIADALPEEMSTSPSEPVVADGESGTATLPNDPLAPDAGPSSTTEIPPTAALGNGRGEGGPKLAPVIGPTVDEMIGGVPPTL